MPACSADEAAQRRSTLDERLEAARARAGEEERQAQEQDEEDEGHCPVFIDRAGNIVETMCCDYGFRTSSGRMYMQGYGQIPTNAWELVSWAG